MKLSICRVTYTIYPDSVGGHSIFCHELSLRQVRIGHKIYVLTWNKKNLQRIETMAEGYSIIRLNKVWMPWDSIGMTNPLLPSLYGSIKSLKTDLIDAHAHLFFTTAIAVKAARDEEKPVITTVHGLIAKRDIIANMAQYAYLWSVGAWALKNSTKVVCLTESEAKEVMKLGVKRKNIEIIPIAIDVEKFSPSSLEKGYLLWIGRLVKEKGIEFLLKAMKLLKEKVKLIIVGDGPLRKNLMHEALSMGLKNEVLFIKEASREQVIKLLQECSLFILPSLREGLPMVLLEAMATGKPIAASNIQSFKEVLKEFGVFFNPYDPQSIAEAISLLLNDFKLRKSLGAAGRELVEEKYSWNAVLPKIEWLYEEVLR
ncbi:MAG: glycosyltransferase family 4 protein [Candidatus Bathyarchaeia archaeon]